MRLDLAERLRCPRPHAPTPLVVVASKVVDRDLIAGVAGCPVCRCEASFRDGDLYLAPLGVLTQRSWLHGAQTSVPEPELDRLMALLGVGDAEGAVLLTGRYCDFAIPLARRTGIAVVVDVPLAAPRDGLPVWAVPSPEDGMPFLDRTFRAAAIRADAGTDEMDEVVRTVVDGGRIIGPAHLKVPPGVRELARDEREWVGEAESTGPLLAIKRASRA